MRRSHLEEHDFARASPLNLTACRLGMPDGEAKTTSGEKGPPKDETKVSHLPI
jgi:hypothetical protein